MKKNHFRFTGILYLAALALWSFMNQITSSDAGTLTCYIDWISGTIIMGIFAAIFMWIDGKTSHLEFNTFETKTLQTAQSLSSFYALSPLYFMVVMLVITIVGDIFTDDPSWPTDPLLTIVSYSILIICFVLTLVSVVLMLTIIKLKKQKEEDQHASN